MVKHSIPHPSARALREARCDALCYWRTDTDCARSTFTSPHYAHVTRRTTNLVRQFPPGGAGQFANVYAAMALIRGRHAEGGIQHVDRLAWQGNPKEQNVRGWIYSAGIPGVVRNLPRALAHMLR